MSRNKLFVNFRFFESAISRLKLEPFSDADELVRIYNETKKYGRIASSIILATDGETIRYNFVNVLYQYKREKNIIARSYLHTLLHCIYRHMFVGKIVNTACWDLACDIAVENIINELKIKDLEIKNQIFQESIIKELKKNIKVLTAEQIYRYYLDKNLTDEEYNDLRLSFRTDSHVNWYIIKFEIKIVNAGGIISNNNNQNSKNMIGYSSDNNTNRNNNDNNGANGDLALEGFSGLNQTLSELFNDWKDISEKLAVDMETFSKNFGSESTSFIQNLKEINREKCDYTTFLKKFAVRGEVMKINDDEFDYIFYTYGMKLYEKMPLIEPLEYKDVKRIKEFVIAIDTSGSVRGDVVQKFIEKTYNILKSTESFFSKINIHIIQCDTVIQEDKKITSQEEFDEYI
ncbi:MAG: metallopeptidase, partial [Clostridia bacterium]|nr:metallopeptidase [Clostridia bacterium]